MLFYIIFINKCLKGRQGNYGLAKYQDCFQKICVKKLLNGEVMTEKNVRLLFRTITPMKTGPKKKKLPTPPKPHKGLDLQERKG